jgi:hypothetical protein
MYYQHMSLQFASYNYHNCVKASSTRKNSNFYLPCALNHLTHKMSKVDGSISKSSSRKWWHRILLDTTTINSYILYHESNFKFRITKVYNHLAFLLKDAKLQSSNNLVRSKVIIILLQVVKMYMGWKSGPKK